MGVGQITEETLQVPQVHGLGVVVRGASKIVLAFVYSSASARVEGSVTALLTWRGSAGCRH